MRFALGLAACFVVTTVSAQTPPPRFDIRGDVQIDARTVWAEADASTFVVRRARLIAQGTIEDRFRFRVMPDFGRGRVELLDAFVETDLARGVAVRVGKFKGPIGLERLRSPTDLDFPELAYPTQLVPNRDLGVHLRLTPGRQTVDLALTNGVPDGASGDADVDTAKDLTARVLLRPLARGPLAGLALGIAATTGAERGTPEATLLPTFQTPGRQTVFRYVGGANPTLASGARTRVVPQAMWTLGPVGVMGEAAAVRQRLRRGDEGAALNHRAWQATATVVLTGEDATYGRLRPRRPFAPEAGQWGAIALAARVHSLALDADAFPAFADPAASVRSATSGALGVNWSLTEAVRVQVSAERTVFTSASGAAPREAETLVVGRLQLVY